MEYGMVYWSTVVTVYRTVVAAVVLSNSVFFERSKEMDTIRRSDIFNDERDQPELARAPHRLYSSFSNISVGPQGHDRLSSVDRVTKVV